MADLIGYFGKQLKGIGAQLNPFDNGADYNSVVNAPQQPQIQTQSQGQLQVRQATSPQVSVARPQVQPNVSVAPPRIQQPTISVTGARPTIQAPQRNPIQQFGDFAGKVNDATLGNTGRFVNNTFIKPVSDHMINFGEDIGRAVANVNPDVQNTLQNAEQTRQASLDSIIKAQRSGLIGASTANKLYGSNLDVQQRNQAEISANRLGTDPTKIIADGGVLALDALTAGKVPKVFSTGRAGSMAFGGGVGFGYGMGGQYSQTGSDTNFKDAVINSLPSAAVGTAMGYLPFLPKDTIAGVKAVKSSIQEPALQAAEKVSGIPRVNVLNNNEAYTLGDFADVIMGRANVPAQVRNNITAQARHAANNAGIDIITGSRAQINERIANYLEARDMFKNTQTSMAQGGYVKLPDGASDELAKKVFNKQTDANSLYHGTEVDSAINILNDGYIKPNTSDLENAVSFARNRNAGIKLSPMFGKPVKLVADNDRVINSVGKSKPYVDGELNRSKGNMYEAEQRIVDKNVPTSTLKRVEYDPTQLSVDEIRNLKASAKKAGVEVVDINNTNDIRRVLSNQQPLDLPIIGKDLRQSGNPPNNTFAEGQTKPEISNPTQNSLDTQQSTQLQSPLIDPLKPSLKTSPTSSFNPVIPQVTGDVSGVPLTKSRGFAQSAKGSNLVSDQAKAQIGGEYTQRANSELMDKVVQRINKDPIKAHDFAMRTNSDEGTATAIALAQQYRNAGKFDLEASLINEKARRLTEAGREVQAASMIDKLSPEGVVASAAQTIQKFNETAKHPIPELTGAIAKQFSDKAVEIGKMAEGRDRNIAVYKLREELSNLVPSSTANKIVTVWKAGLLTSPRTTMRNLVGNTVHAGAELAKDPIAALNDRMLSLKTGNREMTATVKGTVRGFDKGVTAAKDMATLGFDPENSISKFDVNHITWGNNPVEQGLKHYTDIVFRNMGAQDKVFYHSSFARSLYDQAGAEAINAGQKGNKAFIDNLVNNPTERMKVNATKDAQTAVFQNSNVGSQLASKMKRTLTDKNSGLGAISNVVMPFTGVPSSIAGQMIAYSPAGLIKGLANDAKILVGKVKPDMIPDLQRQASQEIGRGVLGTGILSLGAYLTGKGLMTGQPKDAAESAQWQLEGKQANSVMVNGKWRSINSVGPEALIMLAGSKIAQGGDPGTVAANIGKDFTGQTFLSGIQQPLNAISDPARYAGTYLPNQAASVIPNIVKDTAKAFDPIQRETYVPKDIGQSTINSLKAGIPGQRNTLLPKRDALGNPLQQEPSGAGAYVDLFNSKTPIKNPLVSELSRLDSVGQSALPSKLTPDQTILGQKVQFTPQELDQLEQATGQPITQQFNQLISTPEYKNASDELKKKTLDGIVTSVRDGAKLNVAQGQTATNQSTTPNGKLDVNKLAGSAQLTLAKDSFDKSGKNYQVVGDTVLRRGTDGTISATPKVKFDYQVGTATLVQQKASGDTAGWIKTATSQIDSIDKQLQDPSIDPLEAIQLKNDAQTLIDNIVKYKSYGGFTKPKKKSSGSTSLISAQTTINGLKIPTTTGTTAKFTSNLPTPPQLKKSSLKRYTVKSAKVSTTKA